MRHNVLVDNPDPKSMAAAVVLRKRLSKETVAEWLRFRDAFLSVRSLVCTHCGKTGLLKESDDPETLATIDHVIPLSKGGAQYNEDNCVIACGRCNGNRKNTDMAVWLKRRGKR